MKKVLIFDYDGVIFDTVEIAWEIVKTVCNKYCKRKLKTKKDFLETYKQNFYIAMKERGVTDTKKFKQDCIKLLKNKHPKPFKDIPKTMKQLAKKNQLAIVSSNFTAIMQKVLKKAGINNFQCIMGADQEENKVKKIKLCLKKFKPSQAFFITDTVGDIKEAKKARIKTVAVTWGFHSKKELAAANPDFIVNSPKELLELFA